MRDHDGVEQQQVEPHNAEAGNPGQHPPGTGQARPAPRPRLRQREPAKPEQDLRENRALGKAQPDELAGRGNRGGLFGDQPDEGRYPCAADGKRRSAGLASGGEKRLPGDREDEQRRDQRGAGGIGDGRQEFVQCAAPRKRRGYRFDQFIRQGNACKHRNADRHDGQFADMNHASNLRPGGHTERDNCGIACRPLIRKPRGAGHECHQSGGGACPALNQRRIGAAAVLVERHEAAGECGDGCGQPPDSVRNANAIGKGGGKPAQHRGGQTDKCPVHRGVRVQPRPNVPGTAKQQRHRKGYRNVQRGRTLRVPRRDQRTGDQQQCACNQRHEQPVAPCQRDRHARQREIKQPAGDREIHARQQYGELHESQRHRQIPRRATPA